MSATIAGFALAKKEGSGHFIYFDKLYVNLESMSIFKKALIVKSISIAGPLADFELLGDKTFSFSDLLTETTTNKEEPTNQNPTLFSINNIEITNGNFKLNDLPKDKLHQITNLNLSTGLNRHSNRQGNQRS